ncbi:MAG: hypothetical protein LBR18_05240 [Tannerella sp.]|jgi:hypothetical protein|nr:hypothetical protein [Tannerella sp.]
MKEELGKWLMDIAKYIATAVVITSLFGEITETKIVMIVGGIITILVLLLGLFLVKQEKDKITKNKKGKKK